MQCTRCKWYDNDLGVNCIPYSGPERADLLFVGEAFGKTEATKFLETGVGVQFIGKSGGKLDTLLEMIGVERKDVNFTNAIKCYQQGNPTPKKGELDACFIHLQKEVSSLKPKLIIAMGNSSLYQCVGVDGVESYASTVMKSEKLGCNVFVTHHPASCLHNATNWDKLVVEFKQLKFVIENGFNIKHYEYEIIETVERFREIHPSLRGGILYNDTETTGLSPYTNTFTMIQFNTGTPPVYIVPVNLIPEIKTELQDIFLNAEFVGQNWGFDAKFIHEHIGVFPPKWRDDTCLAEYILSGKGGNDLTTLTNKYAKESAGYDTAVTKQGGAQKVKDKNLLSQYAADDVGVLPQIIKTQSRELIKEKRYWLYKNLTLPTNRILTKMSLRGVMCDVEKLMDYDRFYEKKENRAYKKVEQMDCVQACEKNFREKFNPHSSPMIKWILLNYYNLPILKETEKGNPSVGKDEMSIYKEEYNNPYCELMENYRTLGTIRSNFLSGLVPKLVNSVAHTEYMLFGTNTGRPASKNPNLQNLPAEVKDVKKCFIPRPGYVFISSDMSQVEVRVAAVVYEDDNLIKACNSEGDFHCRVAAQAFGYEYEEFYKEYKVGNVKFVTLRYNGKRITFGILYQMGPKKLAYELKIPYEQAIVFIDDYFKGYQQLKKNIDKTKKFVVKNRYVDNPFGFRRWWRDQDIEPHILEREGVNLRVQSTAWNLMELAMIQIDEYLEKEKLDAYQVMQVYDQIVLEVKENLVDKMAPVVKEIMCGVNKPFEGLNRVQLKTDIEISETSLGDLRKL